MSRSKAREPAPKPHEKRLRILLQHEVWTVAECLWLLKQPLSHPLLALVRERMRLVKKD